MKMIALNIPTNTGLLLAASIFISACAGGPSIPPQIEDADSAPIQRELSTNEASVNTTAPETTAATASLLAAAQSALSDDQPKTAVAYLERAIRINSRDPNLWTQLSAAHLADGKLTAANQHARKAIALAGDDLTTQREAWLQMANIREIEGNDAEANAIRRRYKTIRG